MPTVTYASEIHEDTQNAPTHFELVDPGHSHVIEGPYGALVATMATPAMAPRPAAHLLYPASLSPPAATRLERAARLLTLAPMGVWKRVSLYSFLFMVFGNLLRCGGLATSTNLACLVVLVLGLAGVVASAQRNP